MTRMDWVLLAIALLLVVLCGAFGAAEYSFVAVDRAAVDRAAAEGDEVATGVQRALRTLSTQLSAAQIGITLTNLGIGFLAEPAIASLLSTPLTALGLPGRAVPGIALSLGLVLATIVTMIFGELVPKKVALSAPMATARAMQGFQRLFTTITLPAIWVLNGSANAVVRLLGMEPKEELRSARSSDELASLAGRSASEGKLDTDTASLVQRSVAFGPRTAGEIMTPRVRMESVEFDAPVSELITLAASTGLSKFPVTKNSADSVVGAVHVKQAVAVPRGERDTTFVREVMVDAIVVPESLRLDPLLGLLRGEGFQLAVVSDEYGGTAGVVTLEDVVEEIVGDISDEHDRHRSRLRQRPDGSWVISGLLRPDEVSEGTGLELPEHEDYDTVAGLFIRSLGRIPTKGDSVLVPLPAEIDDEDDDDAEATAIFAELTVMRMDGLRVDRLSIRRVEEAAS